MFRGIYSFPSRQKSKLSKPTQGGSLLLGKYGGKQYKMRN